MAPVGVIYDLEKKHGVTMIMIQGTTKANKKSTTKWEQEQQPKETGTKAKTMFVWKIIVNTTLKKNSNKKTLPYLNLNF